MDLHDASDLKNVKYGCTEYAVKRLTGRNLLKETGMKPGEIGFENVDVLTGGQCIIHKGSFGDLIFGALDNTMIRIKPKGQEELHTVIVIKGNGNFPVIEDQISRRREFIGDLVEEWTAAGQRYASCDIMPRRSKTSYRPFPFLVYQGEP